MAATNFTLAGYAKLFALIEAHAPTASKLKPGNEVRLDRGQLQPGGPKSKQAADFPRVILRDKGFTDTTFAEDATFATLNDDFSTADHDWLERITQTYELKVIHDDLRLDVGAQFELEVMTALRKGGPRLGLPYVIGWTTASQTAETDQDPDAMGHPRRVTTITVTVKMMFDGSELIT